MALLDDILAWTMDDLTSWQRDAVRRLFQKQILDQQDYDDLYAMLKSAHGLSDPQNRQPVFLSQEHLPSQKASTTSVVIRSMRDLKHVNRIAEKQKLEFLPKGITIIYGGNSSGKSGYSRVLKRACRARDLSEIVLSDAFDPNAARNIPEAVFDIEVDGQIHALAWKRDVVPPDELSTIAVFDSRCARAYLDAEQDVAYLPYGLDIVENLAQSVLPVLTQRLNSEIAGINTDTESFVDLLGETSVGKSIASLSVTTDPEKVKVLATLTPYESNRLVELDKILAENDPKVKAKAQRLLAQRINGLISRIDTAVAWVNDNAMEKIKACDIDAETASKAEAIVVASFQAGEQLLPGTGDQVWRNLFEAARSFSIGVAFPGRTFPHVEPGAKCPLCQQQLGSEAVNRLQRFEDFVKQEAAKVAIKKRHELDEAEKKIAGASIGFGLDLASVEEIKDLDAALLKTVQEFEKKIESRKELLLGAVKKHTWFTVPALDGDPRENLRSFSMKFTIQANDLDKASEEAQRKVFENERLELRAREKLAVRLKPLLDLIQRMQLKEKLTKCKDNLKTKAISDKAKEFTSRAVTTALKKALDAEFRALGVDHIKTKLNERVEQGKMKHKLLLDLPVAKKLDEILSEGEQRAIAIGSFLAELQLAGHQGGVVFDDPVSSLDHYRRKDVARRLVEEAKKRQVIILTHDTIFLGELRDEIEQLNVEYLIHHLEWGDGKPGHVHEGLPWEHMSYKERLDALEKKQKLLGQNWPTYPNEDERTKMRSEYDFLRATIERVIQDVVFNGVVQRYRDWVRLDKLGSVVGFTEAEYKEIARLHKACCDVLNAHDHSSAQNSPVPSPVQLSQDITDLKAVVETIKKRRKQ